MVLFTKRWAAFFDQFVGFACANHFLEHAAVRDRRNVDKAFVAAEFIGVRVEKGLCDAVSRKVCQLLSCFPLLLVGASIEWLLPGAVRANLLCAGNEPNATGAAHRASWKCVAHHAQRQTNFGSVLLDSCDAHSFW